jgi:hypothetical protein
MRRQRHMGFRRLGDESSPDSREDALASFNQQTAAPPGSGTLPPLGVHVSMGSGAAEKMANHRANLERGLVAPNEIVARAPGR